MAVVLLERAGAHKSQMRAGATGDSIRPSGAVLAK
jgi:hypothetical protein